jgi:hypothetical protein
MRIVTRSGLGFCSMIGLVVGALFIVIGLAPIQAQSAPISDVEVNISGRIYHLQVSLIPNWPGYTVGPVAAPTDLAVVWTSRDSIRLIWRDASVNETQFAIWRRQQTTDWVRVGVVQPNTTVFTDTGLKENQEYIYRVRATNDVNASDWAGPLSVWTEYFPPAPTTEPIITDFLNTSGKSVKTALAGDEVVIVGERFGTDGGVVTFNNQVATQLEWTDNRIRIKLDGFTSGWQPGSLAVWRSDGHYYATLAFAIGVPPALLPVPPPTPPKIPPQ